MSSRSYAFVAVASLLAVIAAAVWMIKERSDPLPAETQLPPPVSDLPASASLQSVAMARPAPPIPPDLPPPKPRIVPSPEAVKDIEDIQFMLRDYRTRLGDNPTGTNAEIMREVMGGNRVKAKLGPPEGQKLNDHGELLDRWGAPYFFHQLSRNEMEIRSAGPDQAMWTADDVVMK
jgi:hypothetical protein